MCMRVITSVQEARAPGTLTLTTGYRSGQTRHEPRVVRGTDHLRDQTRVIRRTYTSAVSKTGCGAGTSGRTR